MAIGKLVACCPNARKLDASSVPVACLRSENAQVIDLIVSVAELKVPDRKLSESGQLLLV